MKAFAYLFVILLALVAPLGGTAQAPDQTFQQIELAIKSSDAVSLSKHFHDQLEVTIEDNEKVVSSTQAQYMVRDFFMTNPLQAFAIKHTGISGDTHYAFGEYKSPQGHYDVNIFIKKYGSTFRIDMIRFERTN
jgi:hypothetical protein